MEYVYAALLLNESGKEINEDNITGVLEGAGISVEESRVKALVAALEDVDIEEAVEQASAAPVPASGGGAAPAEGGDEADHDEPSEEEVAEAEADAGGDDGDDEDGGGEGLGELFG